MSYISIVFLFDVSEEGRIAEVTLAAGTDVGSFDSIVKRTVDH